MCSLFFRRGLTPPHRVKSISMASFTPEEILQIKSQGNDYCKGIWLGLHEGNPPVLKDEQSIKDYMSEKYEKKRFYLDPSFSRKQTINIEKPAAVQNTSPKDNGIWNSSSIKMPTARPTSSGTPLSSSFNMVKTAQVLPPPTEPLNFNQVPVSCPK